MCNLLSLEMGTMYSCREKERKQTLSMVWDCEYRSELWSLNKTCFEQELKFHIYPKQILCNIWRCGKATLKLHYVRHCIQLKISELYGSNITRMGSWCVHPWHGTAVPICEGDIRIITECFKNVKTFKISYLIDHCARIIGIYVQYLQCS